MYLDMPDWGPIFEPAAPLLESFVRGTIIYLGLVALMRVIGQREAGGISITDILLVVLIAQATAVGLYGEAASVTEGLVLVMTFLFWSVVIDALAYRWPRLARFLKTRPRLLIEDGRVNRDVMRRELMTNDELLSQLRLHGVEDVSQVERAYIEPNGLVSLVRRHDGETDEIEPPDTSR